MIIKKLWSYCDRVSFLKKIDVLGLLYPNFLVKKHSYYVCQDFFRKGLYLIEPKLKYPYN